MLMLQRNGKGDEFDSRSSKNDRPRMMASNDGAAGREISDKHSEHRLISTMLASSPRVDALELEGWVHDANGKIMEGKLHSKSTTSFKHIQELKANDVRKMRVEVGKNAIVGFTGTGFDVERTGG